MAVRCFSPASGAGLLIDPGSMAPMKMPKATPITPPATPDIKVDLSSTKDVTQSVQTPATVSPTKFRLDAPRLRKKVSWRGKTCIVSLPNVDYTALRLSRFEDPSRFGDGEEEVKTMRGSEVDIADNYEIERISIGIILA